MMSEVWLGLVIGNSRLHWALFSDQTLVYVWDSSYISEEIIQALPQCPTIRNLLAKIYFPDAINLDTINLNLINLNVINLDAIYRVSTFDCCQVPIIIASVVPKQTEIWRTYPDLRTLTLEDVPLKNTYPTLGIDRAIALFAAGHNFGFPILVIDAGTALTFTGANENQELSGGAILPGLGLQLAILGNKTGQLPNIELPKKLPPRFAIDTPEAMQSGIIYTLLAGIKDFTEAWWCNFPESKVIMTGGDSAMIHAYLRSHYPNICDQIKIERNLIFWGMREFWRRRKR
jgi:type III pantothenate kinase